MADTFDKAYIVAVDMGYGHQRAVFPLLDIAATPAKWKLANARIISANDYPGMPWSDRLRWFSTRKIYESISRIQGFPLFGKRIFRLMSYLEHIEPFYPRRDLSRPILSVRLVQALIRGGFGKHLIDSLNENPLPLLASFPIPAICAEEHGYKGDIYCLCTDTDIARTWVPRYPAKSRIIYLAPTARTRERLKLYGVRSDNIVVTGFPLPKEALGNMESHDVLDDSLGRRLAKLDPQGVYHQKFEKLLSLYLAPDALSKRSDKPLTVAFAIGGAGAQSNIAVDILSSFEKNIRDNQLRLILVAGTSDEIRQKFERNVRYLSLESFLGDRIRIIYRPDKFDYFREFNGILAETDILWTKPSELSFYAGLGLPIIMSPALGSQEEYNQTWLHMMGAGFEQYDPRYAHEWLFDWINSGWLAEAAMNGFVNASKLGADHIADLILRKKRTEIEDVHFV
jgi:hypothetical protein